MEGKDNESCTKDCSVTVGGNFNSTLAQADFSLGSHRQWHYDQIVAERFWLYRSRRPGRPVMAGRQRCLTVITPATIHVKAVIPAEAGIHNVLYWMPDQVRHDI